MNQFSVPIIKLSSAYDLDLPVCKDPVSAEFEILAAVPSSVKLGPKERAMIPTGFCMAVPIGLEAQIRTHAETAKTLGLVVLDSPSCIDVTYRDEVKCLVMNMSDEIVLVRRGMPIGRMAFTPVIKIAWQEISTGQEE